MIELVEFLSLLAHNYDTFLKSVIRRKTPHMPEEQENTHTTSASGR
jgi:hypothetical protein